MLTAEQREALDRLCKLAPSGVVDLRPEIEIVQSLLSDSVPAWEATDERIEDLWAIIGMLNTEVYDKAGPLFEERNRLVRMLLAMLEEAGG